MLSETLISALNNISAQCAETEREKGFHIPDRNWGESLMLMVSELSEGLEDARNGKFKLTIEEGGKPCGLPSELADCVIRIFATCGNRGINIGEAIAVKMEYNKSRPYKHGRKF